MNLCSSYNTLAPWNLRGGGTFYDSGAIGVGVLKDDSSSTETEESKEDFVFFFKLFSEIRETDSLGSETEC